MRGEEETNISFTHQDPRCMQARDGEEGEEQKGLTAHAINKVLK